MFSLQESSFSGIKKIFDPTIIRLQNSGIFPKYFHIENEEVNSPYGNKIYKTIISCEGISFHSTGFSLKQSELNSIESVKEFYLKKEKEKMERERHNIVLQENIVKISDYQRTISDYQKVISNSLLTISRLMEEENTTKIVQNMFLFMIIIICLIFIFK